MNKADTPFQPLPARGLALRIPLTCDSLLARLEADGFYPVAYASCRCKLPWEDGVEEFGACWGGLDDLRTGNAALHDFHDLLMIALCAVLSGGENATDMAEFAKAKEPFLRDFLKLPKGIPSHDTFSRLFRLLDPAKFGAAFQRFMAAFSKHCQGVVAIDGKVLRRSHNRASGKSALHM